MHQLLEEKAGQLKPGESGLLALDWWNGNRTVLVDVDLTGLLLGVTLLTKPEEIYRALIEATAYGTRIIVETFQANGVPIHQIVATGGLPDRNQLLMQIYADVTGRPISSRARTRAAGWAPPCTARWPRVRGGRLRLDRGSGAAHGPLRDEAYTPNPDAKAVYDQLFAEYVTLHDYFGRGANDVMKRLKTLKAKARRPDRCPLQIGFTPEFAERLRADMLLSELISRRSQSARRRQHLRTRTRAGRRRAATSVGWANSYYRRRHLHR